jgi:tetratricopeptide (TPR) repeat protein
MQGDPVNGRARLLECVSAFLELGDETFAARVLMFSGIVSRFISDTDAARNELRQSIELASTAGIRGTQAHAQLTLAQVATDLNDPSAASLFGDCQSIFEMIGDVRCAAVCKRSLGSLALDSGRLDEAIKSFRESLDELAHDPPALAVALADLATVYRQRGNTPDAARLVGAAQVLALQSVGTIPLGPSERARIDAAAAAINSDLHTSGATTAAGNGKIDLEAILEVARAC